MIKQSLLTNQVAEAPVEFLIPLMDISVTEEEEARLECQVSKANARVTWMRDNVVLSSDVSKGKFNILVEKDGFHR